jgi:hypothetical protein
MVGLCSGVILDLGRIVSETKEAADRARVEIAQFCKKQIDKECQA